MSKLKDTVRSRISDLELQLQITRGKVSSISEALMEEKEGAHQIEGALMEAQNTLALIEREAKRAVEEAEDEADRKRLARAEQRTKLQREREATGKAKSK